MKAAAYVINNYDFILNSLNPDEIESVGKDVLIPSFPESLLIELCKESSCHLSYEPTLLHLMGPLVVVGDIHGSFHDLLRILVTYKDRRFLFLGDYVDRGQFSIECLTLLLALLVINPDQYYLIRGNHEFDKLCSTHGFKEEIVSGSYEINNYYSYTVDLYNEFLNVFAYLPLAAVIDDSYLCIHGGLSASLSHVNKIGKLSRPIESWDNHQLIEDLVWADPSKTSSNFEKNPRGLGCVFDVYHACKFLKDNKLKCLIRGHQYVEEGIQSSMCSKVITVFSASSYNGNGSNKSGVLVIDEMGKTCFSLFDPIDRMQKKNAFFIKTTPEKQERKILLSYSLSKINQSGRLLSNIRPIKSGSIFKARTNAHIRVPNGNIISISATSSMFTNVH